MSPLGVAFSWHQLGFEELREIGCDIYYPLTLDKQECFVGVGRGGDKLPVAHKLAEEVLSIPVFPELSVEQQDAVIAAIAEWVK